MKHAPDTPPPEPPRTCPWLKRLGLAGFTFFLVKGLLWLIVPGLLVTLGIGC